MTRRHFRGQALVELALVLPLFTLLLGGIIIFGIGVFYQQQLTNAAREAARYAAIHSATSQCPTTARRDPEPNRFDSTWDPLDYKCDPAELGWPIMTAHARSMLAGIPASQVHFSACWSGYWDGPYDPDATGGWDAPPVALDGTANDFEECTIAGIDPRTNSAALSCPAPATSAADDRASDLAASKNDSAANQVTVFACYVWRPPLIADFIGGSVTMRAVITEAMQHQR